MRDDENKLTVSYETPAALRGDATVIRKDRTFGLLFAVLGIAILVSAWTLTDRPSLGWVVGLMGVIVACSSLSAVLDRSPQFVLDDRAFASYRGNRVVIRWSDVSGASWVTHNEAPYLILRLVDPAAELQPAMLWNRVTFTRPAEADEGDIVLPLAGLDLSPQQVLNEIRRRRDRHFRSRMPAIHPEQET